MTKASDKQVRRFQMFREQDRSGVSGAGLVAEGCVFSNGQVALHWLSPRDGSSIAIFQSLAAVERVHGHKGATHVVMMDADTPDPSDTLLQALRVALNDHTRSSKKLGTLIRMATGDHPLYYRGRARLRKARAPEPAPESPADG